MKVLMINVSCGTGSTGRICTDLAAALEELGHEVKIAYGRDNVNPQFEKYAVKIGSDFEVKYHALYSRLFDASGLGSRKGTIKFLHWIQEYNPDIIHLHNVHGYYINVPLLFNYLKTYGKPIIWTLHDCWAFTGHTAFCDSANCEKWKTGCGACPLLSQYPKSYIDRSRINWKWKKKCFSNIPKMQLITPSNWLAGLVKESFLSEYKVDVIHNGINTSVFKPLENDFRLNYGIENKKVLLGVASVWNNMKGFEDFIKLSKIIDDDTVIVMVGLTEEQIGSLPNNIIGLTRTSSIKELNYIYNSADVFVNLTYCDNYPTTNLEARSCGLPVVTYRTGGSPESGGQNAVIVEKGDIPQIWKEIQQIFLENCKSISDQVQDTTDTVQEYLEKYTWGGYFKKKSDLNLKGKYVILGVASVWDRRKGLADFISLFNEFPQENYQIILVGLSDAQIKELPVGILGLSKTSSLQELRTLYSIADVFVNPTIEDNYPTTNIEASCCGTPVITYKTGGSPESVVKTQVIEKGDVDEIVYMIRNSTLSVSSKKDFDINHMKNSYMKIYNCYQK